VNSSLVPELRAQNMWELRDSIRFLFYFFFFRRLYYLKYSVGLVLLTLIIKKSGAKNKTQAVQLHMHHEFLKGVLYSPILAITK
jgi:hypothetical protein